MSNNGLPPPYVLGLPERFQEWRPFQEEATLAITDAEAPLVQVQPTGSGKSLCYMSAALLGFTRAVFLTSTKSLQRQLLAEFGPLGLVEVKGRNAYECINTGKTCEGAPCQLGFKCKHQDYECHYHEAIRRAIRATFVSTNYHFFTLINRYTQDGLGMFDLLVCDEAHNVPEVLTSCLKVNIKDSELPDMPDTLEIPTWRGYVDKKRLEVAKLIENERQQVAVQLGKIYDLQKLVRLKNKLDSLKSLDEGWLIHRYHKGFEFAPIEVSRFAASLLFNNANHELLTSATVREKTADILGLRGYVFNEYPSTFPAERRPVFHLPTARVDHRMDQYAQTNWLAKMERVIRGRLDRKGIIHTVSYKRAELIADYLRRRIGNKVEVISHGPKDINERVREYRALLKPAVIVSPSLTTGYDFPGSQCEYQIVAKLAFPDSRDPLLKARQRRDPDYGAYLTAQQLVQAAGRGMRSASDRCEVFIVDDHWQWFQKKYRGFLPSWFMDAAKRSTLIPRPPERLEL